MKISFFKPFVDKLEFELINKTLQEDATYMVEDLEKEVANFFNVKHVISTNNATAAKHLCLRAMDIKRGDKIICAVNSFVSVPETIRYFDADPIFVDIDKDDFTMDPNSLESVIKSNLSKKLKAIFVSHLAGQSAQMDILRQIAQKYNLKIINDSTPGVKFNKEFIGQNDFISCFWMQHQNRSSMASTGLILTNDDKIAQKAKLIRSHAIIQDSFDKEGNLDYIYDVEYIGQRYDLNSLCAAFSLAQFKKLQKFILANQKIAKLYDKNLSEISHISTPVKKREHTYIQYIIKIDKNRDGFARELLANGIKVGLHYIPLHLLSYYRNKYSYRVNDFPNALQVYSQILSLPIYPNLSINEIEYICNTIKKVANSRV